MTKNSPAIENRRARHEFHILESLEAGLVLTGTEVKAVRSGGTSLSEAYARFRDGEAWLMGMHIQPYKQGSYSNTEPTRPRKLLLHKNEIVRLQSRSAAPLLHTRLGKGATRSRPRQEILG
jgi:SsrA-binding protein